MAEETTVGYVWTQGNVQRWGSHAGACAQGLARWGSRARDGALGMVRWARALGLAFHWSTKIMA
jgi:hypothetical protein